MEITAAGMDADTVIPTLNPKYALAAPNITAKRMPKIMDVAVNSGIVFSAGTKGLKSLLSLIFLFPSINFLLRHKAIIYEITKFDNANLTKE